MNNSKSNSLSDFDVNDNDDSNDIDMWNAASFDGDPEFDKKIFDRKPISFMGETIDDDEYNNRMLEEKRRKEEQQRAEENQLSESYEESNNDDPFENDTYSVVNEDGYDIHIDKNDEQEIHENVESEEMTDEESEFNDDENQSNVHIEDNSDSEDSSYEGGRFKKFSLFGKKDNDNTEDVEKDPLSENENQFNNTNDSGFSIDFDTEDQHDTDADVETHTSDYDERETEEIDELQYNGSDNEEPLVERNSIQSNSDYVPYKDPNDELKIEDVPNEEESNVSEENDEHVEFAEEETHDEENYSHDMNNYDSEEENFNAPEEDHSSHEDSDSNGEISIEIVNKVIDAINEYNNSDDDVIDKLHNKLDTNDMAIVIYNVINGYETFESDRGVLLLKDLLSKSSIERAFLILEYSDEDVHLLGDTVERVCGRSLNRDSDKIAYAKDIVYTIEETGITSEKL